MRYVHIIMPSPFIVDVSRLVYIKTAASVPHHHRITPLPVPPLTNRG